MVALRSLWLAHLEVDLSVLQFDDVIDNIMRLDDVLGYINPEMQMPNTVLLLRAGPTTHSRES